MKLLLSLLFLSAICALLTPHVYAAACSPPLTGNFTISTDCAFSGTVNGVDSGADNTNTAQLTVSSGLLTINANQTILVGTLILSGGSIAMPVDNTGALKTRAAVYMIDSDSDGYPENTTQYYTQPPGGRRRNLLTSVSSTDCYEGNPNVFPGQTQYFTVHRGDSSFDYNCDSVETKGYDICTCSCSNDCLATPVCTFTTGSYAAACGTSVVSGPTSCTRTADVYGNCTACTGNGSTNTLMECR